MTNNEFDTKTDTTTYAYATREEISSILEVALDKSTNSLQNSLQNKIITELAKKSVTILIGLIIALFSLFGGLTYFISTTNENINLKSQLAQCNIEIKHLQTKLNNN